MKKIHVLGLTLFAVCAFCAIGASQALAAIVPQWLVNGATIALTEMVNANFESDERGLLEDMNATAAGNPDILCEIEGALGWLLSNGEGEVTEGTCGNIEVDKGTCGTPKVEGVNFPWTTLLLEPEPEKYEVDITKGAGDPDAPGWLAECTVLGVKVDDVCTTELGKALIKEVTSDSLVLAEFPEEPAAGKSAWANCTTGGNLQGLIFARFFIHALNSSAELIPLSVSLVEEVA